MDLSAAGNFQTFEGGSKSFCFWSKSISKRRTHFTFLHQTGEVNKTSLVLFDSVWSRENSLLDCITSNDQSVTESYVSKCWEAGSRSFSETPDGRFNISELVEPAGPCMAVGRLAGLRGRSGRRSRDLESIDHKTASMRQTNGETGLKLRRSKRAWLIPGTLWCGAGNKALDFADLGVFEETDKCCREHDHCKDAIDSFGFNYGIFNTNIFTLSHCDCDTKFRRCLHKANDSMSNVVGYGYFNVLKMRCFEFSHRMQCAERTWWGMCKFHQLTKYALVKDATYYNSTSPELEDEIRGAFHQISAGNHTFTTGYAMSSTTLTEDPRTTRGEHDTAPPPTITGHSHQAPATGSSNTHLRPEIHTRQKGKLETCASYKDLDSCRHQIPGMQEKYGLRNSEFTTLYHCNCTARLATEFTGQDQADDVHLLLLDFVSQFCFLLPQNCTQESCFVSSTEAPVLRRWNKGATEGRPLVSSKRKIKRFNSRRSKRKDSSFRLFKKCLRMHSKLHKHKKVKNNIQDHGFVAPQRQTLK
ncbi:group 3 secretory phospholipase A2 [Hoplias malabaricus]|uniref:group 3 secretory phospholipase A2 n=1 Tax=Hoplias malabaricus TaxID=27720 RepID=UPI0034622040